MYRNDVWALDALGGDQPGDANKAYRHAAYRSFVLMQFGKLTRGDRRVIPSCVVKRIRQKFPSPTNAYKGFVEGTLS